MSNTLMDAIFIHFNNVSEDTGKPPRKWYPHSSPKELRVIEIRHSMTASYRSLASSKIRSSFKLQNDTHIG